MPNLLEPNSKILIVKPSSMGDVIHSLPMLHSIKTTFADTKVDWVIARGLDQLLDGHPLINELIVINKGDWLRPMNISNTVREFKALYHRLKGGNYDLVIDLQGLLRSALMTAVTGAKVKIGFSDAREGSPLFYNYTVLGGKDIHAVDRYLKIAETLGCNTKEVRFTLPEYAVDAKLKELINGLGHYVVLIPNARWKTKLWPTERFIELIDNLNETVVVIGGSDDKVNGERIKMQCGSRVIDLTAKTSIGELVYVLRHAKAVISNDTGPMHLAVALNRPTVAIFGPTNPLRTGPYGSNSEVVTAGVECSPCYKKSCSKMSCMNNISVLQVYNAYKNLKIKSHEEGQ